MGRMKNRGYSAVYVVRLLDVKYNRSREVVVPITINTAVPQTLYAFYSAAHKAKETKAKDNEIVVRVSLKGYS